MMMEDDELRLGRALSHARDEARVEVRAFLAEAGLATRVYVTPEGEVFRQLHQLRAVAHLRLPGPVAHLVEVVHLVQAFEHGRILRALDALKASVIGAPLHVAGRELA